MRERTLLAARHSAMAPPDPAWRTMMAVLWDHPAWTAALIVLMAAHILLSALRGGAGDRHPFLPLSAEQTALEGILRLPRIREQAIPVSEPPGEKDPGIGGAP